MASSCRTMIVEDDPAGGRALKSLVAHLGHEVVLASTLRQSLDLLPIWKPDCILLDLMLPDGIGTDLVKRIRSDALTVRIAVTTGAADTEMLSELRRLGVDKIFAKPLIISQVEAFLRSSAP